MRYPDWENRLNAYLEQVRDRPFQYGEHDCILFGCAVIHAITGEDPAAEYRGRYGDKGGAAKALREIGNGTLLRTVDAQFTRKPVGMAQRGDLVWFDGSIGVCVGAQAAFVGEQHIADKAEVTMREGLVMIPRALWQKAWAVG